MSETLCDMKVNKKLVYRSGIDDGALYGECVDRDELYGKNVGAAKVYGEGIRHDVLYSSDEETSENDDKDTV